MHRKFALLAALLVALAGAAEAVTIEAKLADPAQEAAAQTVIHQLKCVVCEGQSLADSDATFAREMRQEIRRMAQEGQSAERIHDYFRSRYGARILMTPPLEAQTMPLWLAPLAFVTMGGVLLWRFTRRREDT